MYQRFLQESKESYFLFGPRGTGKTTWLHILHPEALWIDLLVPELERELMNKPERLLARMEASPSKKTVIIDEVQKVPALLNVVHSSIETKKGYQFVLTGSSSRKLKHTGSNLLGGRAQKKTMHPLMATEMGPDFDLDTALWKGMLPLLVPFEEPKPILEGYISLYLKEEIQTEGLVRHLDQFSRFLEVISFSHGSILNTTNIARECEVKRSTVENYIAILEELLLAYKIPVFTKRAARHLTAHPKFYLFDTGVFQSLRPKGPLDRPQEIDGTALEGLVAQHLVAWCDYRKTQTSVYFWRTRGDLEVDFIVYGETDFFAVEVKNTKKVFPQDTKALNAFLKDYPEAKAFLLYRGSDCLQFGQVLCCPVSIFLQNLHPYRDLEFN